MLYCPYLFWFERILQKDPSTQFLVSQVWHISWRDLYFIHTSKICFLRNSIKNCFNSAMQKTVLYPQEACFSSLSTKCLTATTPEPSNKEHGKPLLLKLQRSPKLAASAKILCHASLRWGLPCRLVYLQNSQEAEPKVVSN